MKTKPPSQGTKSSAKGRTRPKTPRQTRQASSPGLARRVEGESGYAPPVPSKPITLFLDANESRPVAPAAVIQAASSALNRVSRYPTTGELEQQLARRFGVNPKQVLVSAGADDALARFCQATLEPGRTAICTTPTFEMIPRGIRLAGADAVEVPWTIGKFPTSDILEHVTSQTSTIFVVSPNNPTGSVATIQDLRKLRAAAPQAWLALDLAYTEFSDVDLTPEAIGLKNTIIFRTFSKAYGLAGARVGYAIGPEPLIHALRAVGQPYAVSSLSLAIASCWLQHGDSAIGKLVKATRGAREILATELAELGMSVLPSQANFICAMAIRSHQLAASLASRGIAVRTWPNRPGLQHALRLTCPSNQLELDILLSALREIKENW